MRFEIQVTGSDIAGSAADAAGCACPGEFSRADEMDSISLGLAIVGQLVHFDGRTDRYQQYFGQGTTFWFTGQFGYAGIISCRSASAVALSGTETLSPLPSQAAAMLPA